MNEYHVQLISAHVASVSDTRHKRTKTTTYPSSPQTQQNADEIVVDLQEYGLTRNEARVLFFLAKTGPAKASDIARVVHINRTETYRTIRNVSTLK